MSTPDDTPKTDQPFTKLKLKRSYHVDKFNGINSMCFFNKGKNLMVAMKDNSKLFFDCDTLELDEKYKKTDTNLFKPSSFKDLKYGIDFVTEFLPKTNHLMYGSNPNNSNFWNEQKHQLQKRYNEFNSKTKDEDSSKCIEKFRDQLSELKFLREKYSDEQLENSIKKNMADIISIENGYAIRLYSYKKNSFGCYLKGHLDQVTGIFTLPKPITASVNNNNNNNQRSQEITFDVISTSKDRTIRFWHVEKVMNRVRKGEKDSQTQQHEMVIDLDLDYSRSEKSMPIFPSDPQIAICPGNIVMALAYMTTMKHKNFDQKNILNIKLFDLKNFNNGPFLSCEQIVKDQNEEVIQIKFSPIGRKIMIILKHQIMIFDAYDLEKKEVKTYNKFCPENKKAAGFVPLNFLSDKNTDPDSFIYICDKSEIKFYNLKDYHLYRDQMYQDTEDGYCTLRFDFENYVCLEKETSKTYRDDFLKPIEIAEFNSSYPVFVEGGRSMLNFWSC